MLGILYSCQPGAVHQEQHSDSTSHAHNTYYCPMHPEVVSDNSGICPKCKMDLELIPTKNTIDTLSYLIQPSNQTIISSLKPIAPTHNKGVNTIDAPGYLTYNPNLTNTVSARVSGRIEKLYAKYEFQKVSKGQILMELFSPELQTAQSEYLLMFKSNSDNDKSVTEALYQKLINLGMSAASIKEIEISGKVKSSIPIYSPYSGHIHFLTLGSNIDAHGLVWPVTSSNDNMGKPSMGNKQSYTLKEGDYVNKDDLLFTVANETSIWALFKILPRDIPLIKKGDKVDVNIVGETHSGKVDFIDKSFESGDDFYTIRVVLNCTDHNSLILGTIVQGRISVNTNDGSQFWVPKQSVIELGKSRSVVFVKQEVGYTAKEVRIGKTMGEWTAILSGISEKDSIAPVAAYFVDSEAFINVP